MTHTLGLGGIAAEVINRHGDPSAEFRARLADTDLVRPEE
jgi:hypothetical protein